MTGLPSHVIEEDHRLDRAAASAQEALADLRWHWTLDEENPDRVSFRAYAEAVGRSHRTIGSMAQGYADWSVRGAPHTLSLSDCIRLAGLGEERQAAAVAVSEATGQSIDNVVRHHRDRVDQTLAQAREAAERRGTSMEEELPRVARAHEVQRAARAKDRPSRGALFSLLELRCGTARRALLEVLEKAREADLDEEMTDLLTVTVGNLRALLGMIDLAVAGRVDVDWDAELEKLEAGR